MGKKSIGHTKQKSDKYINYVNKYNRYLTSFKTVKTSLKSITKHNESLVTINKAVINVNKIIIHTYQFLKLYCLHKYENDKKIPSIDNKLINLIMKTICIRDPRGSKLGEKSLVLHNDLKKFFDDHYKCLMVSNNDLYYTNLNTVLDYEAISIETCLKTHISEHFISFMNRFINVLVEKNKYISIIKKGNELGTPLKKFLINRYVKKLNLLKKDIFENTNNCPNAYIDIKNSITCFDIKQCVGKIINVTFMNKYIGDLNKYVDDIVKKDKYISIINNDNSLDTSLKNFLINRYITILNSLKKDIIEHTDNCPNAYIDPKSQITCADVKQQIREIINEPLEKKLENDPLSLLEIMIRMSVELENKGAKTFNCFPLRKHITPKYIKLDTTTIVHLLLPKTVNKSNYLTKGNTKLLQDTIWSKFFITNKKVFKRNGYTFNHQISTDGIGCSLLFIRNDLYKPLKVTKMNLMKKPFNYKSTFYVDELTDEEKEELQKFQVIGIDPGKEDLIYATNGITEIKNGKHKTKIFRYSQNQRRKELKTKKYRNMIEDEKMATILSPTHNLLTVKVLESYLSRVNAKSCVYKNVLDYIKMKNMINDVLQKYYDKELFRKLKWYSFINKQWSENNMLNRFKDTFGPPTENIICIGDYDNRNMKNKEPSKGKSFRKLFKTAGYKVYLVNEYNTSKKSFLNGENTEKFRYRRNPRPWKTDERKCHGLLRFKSVQENKLCAHILVNRDFNGSMNILQKAKCILANKDIPEYLKRKFSWVSSTLDHKSSH